jgi:hypothetical protein
MTESLPAETPDWNTPLAPEERERLLTHAAQAVARRGLAIPAILFLEMHRPLFGIAGQGALPVFAPLLAPIFGLERLQTLARLLGEPGAADALISRIEQEAAA